MERASCVSRCNVLRQRSGGMVVIVISYLGKCGVVGALSVIEEVWVAFLLLPSDPEV
jgi:hypothetical protein